MTQAAVIGSPVSHSRSPAIFSFIAGHAGRSDFRYSAIEVKREELRGFLDRLRGDGDFAGVNVTIPHKEALIGLLDDVSPEARAVGAVNVVHRREGKLLGYNTDVFGIVETLAEQGCKIEGEDAWIWGAGGAARATAYALGRLGARSVYVRNRDTGRAAKLCDELGALLPNTRFIAALEDSDAPPLALLVNATPLGMKGSAAPDAAFSEMARLPLQRGALAFDLIYNPERTAFLEAAEGLRLRTVNGLDMLVYQALATWEIWTGAAGSARAARETREAKGALVRHLRERPIFLTGFMGVGKSVVGQVLAAKLGWEFVDTDEWIVRKAGKSVAEIFESQGEPAFRDLEAQAVAEACARRRTVVSLGGGALLDPESFARVENAGSLLWLEASAESLEQRLAATAPARPLLAGLDEAQRSGKIRALLEARRPIYERAQFRFRTDGLRPSDAASGVIKLLFDDAGLKSIGYSEARR